MARRRRPRTEDVREVTAEVVEDDDEMSDEEVAELEDALTDVPEPQLPDRRIHQLSAEDKAICLNVAVKGPAYLRFELGWTAEKAKIFLGRVAVDAELAYLRQIYALRDRIQERTQFFASLRVNQMVPRALQVLAGSLRGDRIADDGSIERSPSRAQFDAAMTVLDRANIAPGAKFSGEDAIPSIDARTLNISLGLTAEDVEDVADAARRGDDSAVRGFMDKFLAAAQDSRDGSGNGKRRKKRRKKRPEQADK